MSLCHPAPGIRISGDIPPPHTNSRRVKERCLYLFIYALLKDNVTTSDYETPNVAMVSK